MNTVLEEVIRLIDRGFKVHHHGGTTCKIAGKKFPAATVRQATQLRYKQRVVRRHKKTIDELKSQKEK